MFNISTEIISSFEQKYKYTGNLYDKVSIEDIKTKLFSDNNDSDSDKDKDVNDKDIINSIKLIINLISMSCRPIIDKNYKYLFGYRDVDDNTPQYHEIKIPYSTVVSRWKEHWNLYEIDKLIYEMYILKLNESDIARLHRRSIDEINWKQAYIINNEKKWRDMAL